MAVGGIKNEGLKENMEGERKRANISELKAFKCIVLGYK